MCCFSPLKLAEISNNVYAIRTMAKTMRNHLLKFIHVMYHNCEKIDGFYETENRQTHTHTSQFTRASVAADRLNCVLEIIFKWCVLICPNPKAWWRCKIWNCYQIIYDDFHPLKSLERIEQHRKFGVHYLNYLLILLKIKLTTQTPITAILFRDRLAHTMNSSIHNSMEMKSFRIENRLFDVFYATLMSLLCMTVARMWTK